MNKESNTTEKLLRQIIDRQVELNILSSVILKNKAKKEIKSNYNWFEQIKNKNDFFKLSKAV